MVRLLRFIFQIFLVVVATWATVFLGAAIGLLFNLDVLKTANDLLSQSMHEVALTLVNHPVFAKLYLNFLMAQVDTFSAWSLSLYQQFTAHSLFSGMQAWLLVGLILCKWMLLKTLLLPGNLPIFGLLGIAGLMDGLVMRDIRTFSAGRESASVYYQSQQATEYIVYLSVFLILILPERFSVALPMAVAFGVAIFFSASRFKKYV